MLCIATRKREKREREREEEEDKEKERKRELELAEIGSRPNLSEAFQSTRVSQKIRNLQYPPRFLSLNVGWCTSSPP